MNKQIIKDTAEYNYNLGYLKAIKDIEKIINWLNTIKEFNAHDDFWIKKTINRLEKLKEKK